MKASRKGPTEKAKSVLHLNSPLTSLTFPLLNSFNGRSAEATNPI